MKKVALLLMTVLVSLGGCVNKAYDGECEMAEDAFVLDYTTLDEELSHEMYLSQGDQVNVNIERLVGDLDIYIENKSSCIYQGNDPEDGDFVITVGEEGLYNFRVIGKGAQGRVSFVLQNSFME